MQVLQRQGKEIEQAIKKRKRSLSVERIIRLQLEVKEKTEKKAIYI